MISKYASEIVGILISILLSVIFGLITSYYEVYPQKDAATYSLILSLLGICITYLIQQNIRIKESHFELIKLDRNINNLQSLADGFENDFSHIAQLRARLHNRRGVVRETGFETLTNYMGEIRNEEYGFSISGEYWSLKCYQTFWYYLLLEQRERNAHGKNGMVARITHSSSIKLWHPDNGARAEELIVHQREFIDAGGTIVRILIGPDKEMSSDYKKVKKIMEDAGVEVKYIQARSIDDRSFDFLWIHDEEYIAKWYTGVGGYLDKCEISDKPEPDIMSRWRVLADRAEREDSPIKKIPPEKSIF